MFFYLLTLLLLYFNVDVFAQHGKYNEDGMRRERPLTTFPHDKSVMNQREWLEGSVIWRKFSCSNEIL